jgi:hypothetical protein
MEWEKYKGVKWKKEKQREQIAKVIPRKKNIGFFRGKILGAKFCPWANFPLFFPKKNSPISIFQKLNRPNSIG